ncbi:MAG: NUDIX hydrolase [Desulfosarcinaceae bacterium]|jgi:ADP-ribose pyrophosphatase YjhB (NUDIX family)
MNYCSHCGGPLISRIPPDDDRLRCVCPACGRVHYQNPKLVVGCIPLWEERASGEERILICKRAIGPRLGYWTLPAGYLENGETAAQGAARETLEETGAEVVDLAPYRMYDIVHVHQIYFIFRARLKAPDFHPTEESAEVKLISESQIPWDEIAFPVIQKSLEDYLRDRPTRHFPFANDEITTRLE